MNYEMKLTALQNKVVRDAAVLYMDVNSGKLEAILDTPFIRRRLDPDNGRAVGVVIMDGIRFLLTDSKERDSFYSIMDFPLNFFSKTEGTFCFTEKQGNFLIRILDFYSRINIGQTNMLMEQEYIWQRLPMNDDRYRVEAQVDLLKDLIGMPRNGSHGIGNPECPEGQQAYDIKCVIRHRMAWDKAGNPPSRDFGKMFGVDYDPPLHTYRAWPLPEIQRVS